MSAEIQTFLLAMTPIGELRVSLPMALAVYHIDWKIAFFLSVIGNLIPSALILAFLPFLSKHLSKKCKVCQKFLSWLFERIRKKHNAKMEKYGALALATFVAIPLPLTGAWTGALIAFLFNIPFLKAFPLIALGVAMAGIIVLGLTSASMSIERYFGWQILLGIILVSSIIWIFLKNFNPSPFFPKEKR
ncbi:small multi-drug export protein [Patescibacteria group bacterium]|nr:small multi-drug export protein [Patescibacteria group bacterium]